MTRLILDPEASLAYQIADTTLPAPERQYRFHPQRRWAADFAWPADRVLLEVDGGSWIGGRHTSGAGFAADCVKGCEAAVLGWRVLHVTPEMVEDGSALRYLERVLGQ